MGVHGTVGQTARTLGQLQRCGSPWDVLGSPVRLWNIQELRQLPKMGVLRMSQQLSYHSVGLGIVL